MQTDYPPALSPHSGHESEQTPLYNTDHLEEQELYLSETPRKSRRSHLCILYAPLAVVSCLGLLFLLFWTTQPNPYTTVEQSYQERHINVSLLSEKDSFGPEGNLNGPPTAGFRDNLKPDVKYITSWISAGWTNDVMTYINLMYLGLITDRVPIIPMFMPSHIGGGVPPIDFGYVFDVPRLRKALDRPILEWHEVKDRLSNVVDELGCWGVWEAVQDRQLSPRYSPVPDRLRLDISYTKAPTWIKAIPKYQGDQHATFWSLATLAYPETRAANLVKPLESPNHHVSLPPDQHLLCYDYLYYVCANQPYEFDFDYSPAWRYVGQHVRWTPILERLADQYVRKTTGAEGDQPTPPWITIHVRHGDFVNMCGDVPLRDCFAPLPVIARRVQEVKDELLQQKGVAINHVIMTSDEKNDTWWQEVAAQGWLSIDHSRTVELFGDWYPVLIDAVIQSRGVGFVGTDKSTMSILARRRVQSWQGGVARIFRWGRPGEDDH